jgi:hypothetical protein
MSMEYKPPKKERIKAFKLNGSLEITINSVEDLEKAKELLYQAQEEYGLPDDLVECAETYLKPTYAEDRVVVRHEPCGHQDVSVYSVTTIPKKIVITTVPEEYKRSGISFVGRSKEFSVYLGVEKKEINREFIRAEPYEDPLVKELKEILKADEIVNKNRKFKGGILRIPEE